jgi:hypothetical protein
MRDGPRFTLKAILVTILLLTVPLGLIATRQVVAFGVGISLLPVWSCGSIGHLLAGTKGRYWGLWIGIALQPFAILVAYYLWGLLE